MSTLRTAEGDYDIVSAIGRAGLLVVVRDVLLPELSEGVVHLVDSDIDSDLTFYMEHSEQIPTIIQTFVNLDDEGSVLQAGGLLLQPLPPYEPDMIAQVRERLLEMPPLSDLLSGDLNPQALLAEVMTDLSPEFISKYPVRFECNCSRRAVAAAAGVAGQGRSAGSAGD